MSAPARRPGLGFGAAVGVGIAFVLLIGALAIGHAVFGQLEGAARTVIVFAEVALCVVLGAVVVGILGGLAFGAQLARLHLAERRAAVTPLTVRAEVVESNAEALASRPVEALPPAAPRTSPLGWPAEWPLLEDREIRRSGEGGWQ